MRQNRPAISGKKTFGFTLVISQKKKYVLLWQFFSFLGGSFSAFSLAISYFYPGIAKGLLFDAYPKDPESKKASQGPSDGEDFSGERDVWKKRIDKRA